MLGRIAGAVLASLGVQDAPPPIPAPRQMDSPAMAAAKANRTKMKTRSKFKSSPVAEVPEQAKANGEHGAVQISAIIGTDGRLAEPRIALSSRSATLDARAMEIAAQTIFEPARDAEGNAIALPAQLTLEFSNLYTPGQGGGVLRYRCDQFVRDQEWWKANWSEKDREPFYNMSVGTLVLLALNSGGTITSKSQDGFKNRWAEAIEACRKAPEALAIDQLGPVGEAMRRLATKTPGGL